MDPIFERMWILKQKKEILVRDIYSNHTEPAMSKADELFGILADTDKDIKPNFDSDVKFVEWVMDESDRILVSLVESGKISISRGLSDIIPIIKSRRVIGRAAKNCLEKVYGKDYVRNSFDYIDSLRHNKERVDSLLKRL